MKVLQKHSRNREKSTLWLWCECLKYSGVARICCEEGQRLKLCHGALTVDFMVRCSSCSMTNVTNAVGAY